MKLRVLAIVPAVTLALVGCSQDDSSAELETPPPIVDEAVEEQQAATEPAPAAPVPQQQSVLPAGDFLAQDLNAIPTALEGQNYDAAVTSLSAMRHIQMTPDQQKAYQQQIYQTQEYLRQQAATDPRARDAYNRMGRQLQGR